MGWEARHGIAWRGMACRRLGLPSQWPPHARTHSIASGPHSRALKIELQAAKDPLHYKLLDSHLTRGYTLVSLPAFSQIPPCSFLVTSRRSPLFSSISPWPEDMSRSLVPLLLLSPYQSPSSTSFFRLQRRKKINNLRTKCIYLFFFSVAISSVFPLIRKIVKWF